MTEIAMTEAVWLAAMLVTLEGILFAIQVVIGIFGFYVGIRMHRWFTGRD